MILLIWILDLGTDKVIAIVFIKIGDLCIKTLQQKFKMLML